MQYTSATLLATCLLTASMAFAQTAPKTEKKEIVIEKKEGNKKEKMEIVIDGDKVTINGKPADEYRGDERIIIDEDIIINGNTVVIPGGNGKVWLEGASSNRPLLGVMTETDEKGARIESVTEESSADRAGLKEGDVITMINKTAVSTPQELTDAIRSQKPGDEIDVTFLRDGKTKKVKATLGKATDGYSFNSDDFKFNFEGGRPYTFTMPRMPSMPRVPFWSEDGGRNLVIQGYDRPKYGMQIQDDEDNRGVTVIDVEEGSNADKGGLKESDIITSIDGEKVDSVDDLKEKLASRKDKPSVSINVLRDGKTESLTVKVPRKLKSASL